MAWLKNCSGHDDFVLETAGRYDQQKCAHGKKCQTVGPQVLNAGAAKNDSAGDVDEITGGNEIADDPKKDGHGLAGENVAGKENAGQDGDKRELHGFALGAGPAGN